MDRVSYPLGIFCLTVWRDQQLSLSGYTYSYTASHNACKLTHVCVTILFWYKYRRLQLKGTSHGSSFQEMLQDKSFITSQRQSSLSHLSTRRSLSISLSLLTLTLALYFFKQSSLSSIPCHLQPHPTAGLRTKITELQSSHTSRCGPTDVCSPNSNFDYALLLSLFFSLLISRLSFSAPDI